MASKGVEIKSPVKGVNKNLAWGDHTPEWALDALNVLPYDRFGRQRVNQRPGTSRLLPAALAAAPVLALAQTTAIVDPAAASPTEVAFNETYGGYADGALASVAPSGRWYTSKSPTFPGTSSTPNNSWAVGTPAGQSYKAAFPADNTQVCTAVLLTPPAMTSKYTLKAIVYMNGQSNMSNTNSQTGVGFVTRVNTTNYNSVSPVVWCAVNQHHAAIYQDNNTLLGTHAAALANGEHTIELRVDGVTFKLYVNNVLRVTATATTAPAAWNAVGFYGNALGYVKQFQILTTPQQSLFRQTSLVAVCNGNVYLGDRTALAAATGGTAAMSTTSKPQTANSQGKVYLVDGTNTRVLDIASATVAALSSTAGTAPAGCTLAAVYRDRLVLAAPYSAPQNFFASRVGTHTDWDYSKADPAAAFAGNASTAGRVGEPIVALIPASEDVLYIGGDHTLWAVRGDPADGGSIDLVSDAVGVYGPESWCKAPDGTVYFLGTGGLFKIAGGTPELLSHNQWADYFRQLDRTANYVTMTWDRDRHGLYLFVTPVAPGTAGTHLFYDGRSGGLWPIQYPDTHGPVSALVFDGDAPNDRVTLMGGRDGHIYQQFDTDASDNNTAITSHVSIGPFKTNALAEQTLEWLDVVLGETISYETDAVNSVTVQVRAGTTPERALNQPERTVSRTFSGRPGRQSRWRQRIRGNSFVLRLSNAAGSKTWQFDGATAMVLPSGTVRRP